MAVQKPITLITEALLPLKFGALSTQTPCLSLPSFGDMFGDIFPPHLLHSFYKNDFHRDDSCYNDMCYTFVMELLGPSAVLCRFSHFSEKVIHGKKVSCVS